jgi:Fe-S oxidoreductase
MLRRLLEKVTQLTGNTMYYPGCLTRFAAPEIEANYKAILDSIGVETITVPEFVCCGSPVINAGYEEDYRQLLEKNKDIFRKYAIKKIITNCPSCYRSFRENFNIPVEHISQTLFKNIHKLDKRWNGEGVCYHDPCHLGRHSGIYKEPRKVLEAIGLKITEMANSKEEAMCCGGGAGLRSNRPGLSAKIARLRMSQCKEKLLITTCTLCYNQLKEAAPEGVRVLEFSEAIINDKQDS